MDTNGAVSGTSVVSVYGRNLSNGAGSPESWVYLQPSSGSGEWVTASSVNPYRVQFTLPSGLSTGATYQVWIYNGHGGVYGWSEVPTTLTVSAAVSWSGGTTINVKDSPYDAAGDGSTDDGPAIESAISALSPGDTLFFPAGTYVIGSDDTGPLLLPPDVRVMGDSEGTTTIKFDVEPMADTASGNSTLFEIGVPDNTSAESNIDIESSGFTYAGPTGSGGNLLFSEMSFLPI